jgi:hypothetical protein
VFLSNVLTAVLAGAYFVFALAFVISVFYTAIVAASAAARCWYQWRRRGDSVRAWRVEDSDGPDPAALRARFRVGLLGRRDGARPAGEDAGCD